MELIPILSTMILVGTVATFILAVAAYILYKIREKKGQGVSTAESAGTPSAETYTLITPATTPPPPAVEGRPAQAATYIPPAVVTPPLQAPSSVTTPVTPPPTQAPPTTPPPTTPPSSILWEVTEKGYMPVQLPPNQETRKDTSSTEEKDSDFEWL